MTMWGRLIAAAGIVAGAVVAFVVAPAGPAAAATLGGTVEANSDPVVGSDVTLFLASDGAPTALGTTTTDATGAFTITFDQPAANDAVLYVLAEGGVNDGTTMPATFVLAAGLGTGTPPASVVVNELTTVGTAFSLAQFVGAGGAIAGTAPGLPNASDFVAHLADVTTGQLGVTISDALNADPDPDSSAALNSLANAIAACVDDITNCAALLTAATPAGEPAPTNTFEAIARIADVPTSNVAALYALSQSAPAPFAPALVAAPDAWTVTVLFDGDGQTLDGPGQFAIDAEGKLWIGNNYTFQAQSTTPACAGKQLMVLDPTRTGPSNLQAFPGGGVDGVGFGITLDATGNIWLANFGFRGVGCSEAVSEKTLSEFTPDGMAVSPATGYEAGGVNQPQGIAADLEGNVWTANCGGGSVTVFPDGDPDRATELAVPGMLAPFGLAMDDAANAWAVANGASAMYGFGPDGSLLPGSPFTGAGINQPMGVAVDSAGNKWVANLRAPFSTQCASYGGGIPDVFGSVSWFNPDGSPARATAITGGGMWNSWGIAVDGEDHIWVASFGRQRLSELCGIQPATCPQGVGTAEPISGVNGYPYDGLTRNTGVVIDQSGNVWLANNWLNDAAGANQANPGGKSIAAYVGLAAPTAAPLVRGTADTSIALATTVGTDPASCGTASTITVLEGSTVYYCYTVTNIGGLPLEVHSLTDDRLGAILSDADYELLPGASIDTVQLGVPAATVAAVADVAMTSTATWSASGLTYESSAQATATVNVSTAPPPTTIPPSTTIHNQLPDTGGSAGPTALIGALTLTVGAALLVLGRRPRRNA